VAAVVQAHRLVTLLTLVKALAAQVVLEQQLLLQYQVAAVSQSQ
jgi:hypothetical protein